MKDPPQDLVLDPELVGHDPALAHAMESLKHPSKVSALEAETLPEIQTPPGAAAFAAGLTEQVPPSDGRFVSKVPSGFLTQALPTYWALPANRRLPWKSLILAGTIVVVGSSAIAWGMVYLLKPAAFAKAPEAVPTAAPAPIQAPELRAVKRAAVAPPPARSVAAPAPTASNLPRREPASLSGGGAAPSPGTSTLLSPAPRPEPPPAAKERKAWFE